MHRSVMLNSVRSTVLRAPVSLRGSFTKSRALGFSPVFSGSEVSAGITAASGVVSGLLVNGLPSELFSLPFTLLFGDEGFLHPAPTPEFAGRLALLFYFLAAFPAPVWTILDFFLARPLQRQGLKRFRARDFQLRQKLGGGSYGVTFEGVRNYSDGRRILNRTLTSDEKDRRVVLKRVNLEEDDSIRADLFNRGTIAKTAAETGRIEAFMNYKIKRSPAARKHVAEFIGDFTADDDDYGFIKGTQWLVWNFESDSTLSDALDGTIGAFPESLSGFMLRSRSYPPSLSPPEVQLATVREIMREILEGIRGLHSIGIVHRDCKPENLLVTVEGRIKFIDMGAAVDMSTGINWNPDYGFVDARYAPPEELVVPSSAPRLYLPFLAALFAPIKWAAYRPDLFDTFAAGMILLQMSVPELRNPATFGQFRVELDECDYDLKKWREKKATGQVGGSPRGSPRDSKAGGRGARSGKRVYDFSLLDARDGAGFDLATKLVSKRNESYRGRLSASEALGHRYFSR